MAEAHNTNETFKPYNPLAYTTKGVKPPALPSPNLPDIVNDNGGLSGIQVWVLFITIVLEAVLDSYFPYLKPVWNLLFQEVRQAAGLQDGINWGSFAMSAVTPAANGASGAAIGAAENYAGAYVVNRMLGDDPTWSNRVMLQSMMSAEADAAAQGAGNWSQTALYTTLGEVGSTLVTQGSLPSGDEGKLWWASTAASAVGAAYQKANPRDPNSQRGAGKSWAQYLLTGAETAWGWVTGGNAAQQQVEVDTSNGMRLRGGAITEDQQPALGSLNGFTLPTPEMASIAMPVISAEGEVVVDPSRNELPAYIDGEGLLPEVRVYASPEVEASYRNAANDAAALVADREISYDPHREDLRVVRAMMPLANPDFYRAVVNTTVESLEGVGQMATSLWAKEAEFVGLDDAAQWFRHQGDRMNAEVDSLHLVYSDPALAGLSEGAAIGVSMVNGASALFGARNAYSLQRLDALADMASTDGLFGVPNKLELTYPVRTNPNEAFFWSGNTDGIGGEAVARQIAIENKGTTLESLIDARNIQMPKWDATDPSVVQAWKAISSDYAAGSSGTVRAVVGQNLRPGNVWESAELPALMRNSSVDRIIAIDPATKLEIEVFVRGKK